MSEAAAERLYGPAPEGDEEPTANQYPSDPGETSGPFPFEAMYLSGAHLGHTIRVKNKEVSVTGMLVGVKHHAELIQDNTLFGPPSYVLGEKRTLLRFATGFLNVGPEASVELLG